MMRPIAEHWTIRIWPFSERGTWFIRAFGEHTGSVVPVSEPRRATTLGAARKLAREMCVNFNAPGGAGLYGDDTAEIVEAPPNG